MSATYRPLEWSAEKAPEGEDRQPNALEVLMNNRKRTGGRRMRIPN